jgi:hypothetical protein
MREGWIAPNQDVATKGGDGFLRILIGAGQPALRARAG